MTRLRSFLHARRWLALLIVVAALAVRIVVPPGMMFGAGGSLVVCSGHTMSGMAMGGAMSDMATGHAAKPAKGDPAKDDAPCAFTGLLAVAADGPVLPALAPMPRPAVVAGALSLATIALRPTRLWPPLRGPPGLRAA